MEYPPICSSHLAILDQFNICGTNLTELTTNMLS